MEPNASQAIIGAGVHGPGDARAGQEVQEIVHTFDGCDSSDVVILQSELLGSGNRDVIIARVR